MKRPLESDYTSQAAYTRALEMYCEDYGDALPIAYQSGYYDGNKQRPWVGLTEEDMKKSWYDMENIMGWYSFQEVARAIEAKLKERNAQE
jgi:hypothetical protein